MPISLNPVNSGYNLAAINQNFQKIENSWDEKLDREVSSQGNQMEQDLDMNDNYILNVPDAIEDKHVINLRKLKSYVEDNVKQNEIDRLVVASTSLNVPDAAVIYSTDTTKVLDDVQYIYDNPNEIIWSKPSGVQPGDVIVSIVGDQLAVTSGTYTMKSSSDSDERVFDNAAEVSAVNLAFEVSKALKTKGFHSPGDGGSAEYIVKAGAGPVNHGNLPLPGGNHAALQPTTVLKAKNFGVKADGVTDDTAALWAMANKAKAMGGAILLFDEGGGEIVMSIAESENTYCCWRIPSNCVLKGGKFRRLATERGDDGILIGNDNHDTSDTATITSRTAATNITVDGIDISDGALTPNRVRGDLLAFIHCTDITVKNCTFGNHDQHCIDIGHSKNVYVYQNTGVNNIITTDSCADFQMDWGNAYGTTNTSAINNQGCENVYIYNNDMKSAFAEQQIHWHSGNHINTNVYHNKLEISGNGSNLGADNTPQQGLTTLNVYNNHCITNDFAGAFFRCKSGRNNIFQNDGVNVYKNYITGKCRSGAVMGFSQSPNVPHATTKNFNCSVADNVFDLDWSGITSVNTAEVIAGKYWHDFKATGNIVKINVAGTDLTGGLQILYDQNNQDTLIHGNRVELTGTATFIEDGRCLRGVIDHCVTNNERRTINYTDNLFIASGFKYQIGVNTTTGIESFKLLSGRIGGNRMQGTTVFAEMFTPYPLSDGTNNAGFVDFSTTPHPTLANQPHWLALSSGTNFADIPLPGSAASNSNNFGIGRVVTELQYSGSQAGIDTSSRAASMFVESSGNAVGVAVSAVDIANGTFDLQTGNAGTAISLSSTGVPTKLSNGYVRVWAGI